MTDCGHGVDHLSFDQIGEPLDITSREAVGQADRSDDDELVRSDPYGLEVDNFDIAGVLVEGSPQCGQLLGMGGLANQQ